MATKVCSKCGVEKNLDEFTKLLRNSEGRYSSCKQCRHKAYLSDSNRIKEKSRKYHWAHREQIRNRRKKYYLDNWDIFKEKRDVWRKENKENWKEYHKEYQKVYIKTERGKAKIARANHKRRQLENQSEISLTHEQWAIILGLQQYQCACCGEFFDRVIPEKDHIVPISKGGGLTILNTQALCRFCNSSKNNKMIDYRTNNHKTTIRV